MELQFAPRVDRKGGIDAMRKSRPFVALIAVGIVAVLVVTNAWTISRYNNARQRQTRSLAAQLALSGVLMSLLDAETGQRGYLISEDPQYLTPFVTARGQLREHLLEVRELLQDDPEQLSELAEVERLAMQKMRELEKNVAAQQQDETGTALELVRTDEGKLLMDEVRARVARLQERINLSFAERTEQTRNAFGLAFAVVLAASAGLIVLGILILWIDRDLAAREKLEISLREALEGERRSREAAEALANEVTAQTKEVEQALRDERSALERSERKVQELERRLGSDA